MNFAVSANRVLPTLDEMQGEQPLSLPRFVDNRCGFNKGYRRLGRAASVLADELNP
jgi:hypothetical protein